MNYRQFEDSGRVVLDRTFPAYPSPNQPCSGSPVAVGQTIVAEWLIPQEKATFRGLGNAKEPLIIFTPDFDATPGPIRRHDGGAFGLVRRHDGS